MKQVYNHYFPTPAFLSMNPCAIDISDQSIKYGELVATSCGIRLGRYGKETLPTGIVVSGKIENEEKLIAVLKKIKEKEKFSFIRIALPEEQMYIFTMSLPALDKNNLRGVILLQIEDHIPLKADEAVFDYDIVSENNQNICVEVSASSRTIVESYLSVLKKAGMTPLSFELEAEAIARCVIPFGDQRPVMIVDFGTTRTGVTIVNKERVFLTTTLSIGGINFDNMISKNFSLSIEEAEKMKYTYGLDNQPQGKDIFPAILSGLSVLRDELNKQCMYWESHQSQDDVREKISRIILCGGDSNLAGLREYLEISMKIKVEHANVWVNLFDIKDNIPSLTYKESLSYTTVLGLALSDYLRGNKKVVNVLPELYKKNIKKTYWARFFSVFLDIGSLMIILAIILLIPSFFFSKTKENIAEERLEQLNNQNKSDEIKNFNETIKDINNKLIILEENKPSYLISNKIFKELLSLKTAGVTFSQINYNKKNGDMTTLEIRGKAIDRTSLKNFKTALDNNPNYKEVNLPISNFIEKSNLDFIISIIIK